MEKRGNEMFYIKIFMRIMALSLFVLSAYANTEFPGREKYPQIPFIELEALYKQKDKVVIIDARSPYEYETLRIRNAELVPLALSTKEFEKEMIRLRTENPSKKLVFYCNGHNCMKSYKAARRSIVYLGQGNVFAFDAGVFDWAEKYPDEALLLGENLGNASKLISKEKFKKHFLPAEKFIKQADKSVAILDIRDRVERDGFYLFSGFENSISLNEKDKEKLEEFFIKLKKTKKPLYVYDTVGKQVRWFQYYIESKGIKDYYFMEGGAEAFFKIPLNNLLD